MKKLPYISIMLILCAVLAACGAVQPEATQTPADVEATQVAQYVEQTQAVNQAVETQVQATQVVAMTETATSQPTATATLVPATPTSTALPTNTATPTKTPLPTATSTPTICNAAQLVTNMTVESGASFPAHARFTKVWRVKNVGSCTWTKDFSIEFSSGRPLAGQSTKLTKNVAPGETIDIAVAMKAPDKLGTYEGSWLLKDAKGNTFGTGSAANKALNVKIKVTNLPSSYVYDFAANICNATWKNDLNTLYCSGTSDGYNDYVQYANSFQMETGKWEDEPVILATISKQERIRGKFPAVEIHSGDRFVAEVGCVYGSEDCRVMMRLSYQVKNGGSGVLGEWLETYDGSTTIINLDLSTLAGKEVIFTLDMETKSTAASHQVFWFVPSIRNP